MGAEPRAGPGAPGAALDVINNWEVCSEPADNPPALGEVLGRLAGGSDALSYRSVAKNPNTAADVLARLAGNGHMPELRSRAVRNPNIPADLLVRFTGDLDPCIRRLAASKVSG